MKRRERKFTPYLFADAAFLSFVFALHGSLLTHTIDFYNLTDACQN